MTLAPWWAAVSHAAPYARSYVHVGTHAGMCLTYETFYKMYFHMKCRNGWTNGQIKVVFYVGSVEIQLKYVYILNVLL